MRALLQRVESASVSVNSERIAEIGFGWLVFAGVGKGDTNLDAKRLVEKIVHLRLFNDEEGKFNRSIVDVKGQILIVSQFTLYADLTSGRRPSFFQAESPNEAIKLIDVFIEEFKRIGLSTSSGKFGADMKVELINSGPVTIWIDSSELGGS